MSNPMDECSAVIKEGTGIYELYQRMKKAGVTDEEFDKGFYVTDYKSKERRQVCGGDGEKQEEEVREIAYEHYERFQLDIQQTLDEVVAWSLDDLNPDTPLDEGIRTKANQTILFFKETLIKAGYQEGTDRHEELLGLGLFLFALFPTEGGIPKVDLPSEKRLWLEILGAKERLSFHKNNGRLPELEEAGLGAFFDYLENNGGLGLIEIPPETDCEIESTALEALEEDEAKKKKKCGACTEFSYILYALDRMAGLKATFVWSRPNKGFRQIAEYFVGEHEAVGLILKHRIRIFDLGAKTSDAEIFYKENMEDWYAISNREVVQNYYLNMAGNFVGKRQFDQARAAIEKLKQMRPNVFVIHVSMGSYHFVRKEYDQAIDNFTKAIEIDPDFVGSYFGLGKAYWEKYLAQNNPEDLDRAIEFYCKAIRLLPNWALAYFLLAKAYLEKGDIDLAVEAFKKTIQFSPDASNAYYALGRIYLGRKELDACIEALERAIQIDPKLTEAYIYLGKAYSSAGKLDLAIEVLIKAAQKVPDIVKSDEYQFTLGNAYAGKGRFDLAVEAYKKAIDIQPASIGARNSLAVIYIHRDEYPAAIDVVTELLKGTSAENARQALEVFNNLAEAFMAKWQNSREQQKMVARFDKEVSGRFNLAKIAASFVISAALWRAGKDEGARGQLGIVADGLTFTQKPSPSTKKFFAQLLKIIPKEIAEDQSIKALLEKIKAKLR